MFLAGEKKDFVVLFFCCCCCFAVVAVAVGICVWETESLSKSSNPADELNPVLRMLFRSIFDERSMDQTHRTPVWRSTSAGTLKVRPELILRSTPSTFAPVVQ